MQWPAGDNRASNVPVTIKTVEGDQASVVNQRENGGQWNEIGLYNLGQDAAVTIHTEGTNGYVIADAVQFEYMGPLSTVTQPCKTVPTAIMSNKKNGLPLSGIVRIPAGVAGIRLYSLDGRLMYQTSAAGDISRPRMVTTPLGRRGITACIVEYLCACADDFGIVSRHAFISANPLADQPRSGLAFWVANSRSRSRLLPNATPATGRYRRFDVVLTIAQNPAGAAY